MSRENVKKFMELARTEENLSRKFVALRDGLQKGEGSDFADDRDFIEKKILPLAMEYGLEFTADEFMDFTASQITELSADDLADVSGGFSVTTLLVGLSLFIGGGFAPTVASKAVNYFSGGSNTSVSQSATHSSGDGASLNATDMKSTSESRRLGHFVKACSLTKSTIDDIVNKALEGHVPIEARLDWNSWLNTQVGSGSVNKTGGKCKWEKEEASSLFHVNLVYGDDTMSADCTWNLGSEAFAKTMADSQWKGLAGSNSERESFLNSEAETLSFQLGQKLDTIWSLVVMGRNVQSEEELNTWKEAYEKEAKKLMSEGGALHGGLLTGATVNLKWVSGKLMLTLSCDGCKSKGYCVGFSNYYSETAENTIIGRSVDDAKKKLISRVTDEAVRYVNDGESSGKPMAVIDAILLARKGWGTTKTLKEECPNMTVVQMDNDADVVLQVRPSSDDYKGNVVADVRMSELISACGERLSTGSIVRITGSVKYEKFKRGFGNSIGSQARHLLETLKTINSIGDIALENRSDFASDLAYIQNNIMETGGEVTGLRGAFHTDTSFEKQDLETIKNFNVQ